MPTTDGTDSTPSHVPSRRVQLGLKLGVVTLVLATGVALAPWLRCLSELPEGIDLNRFAWEQSYRERGEAPPPDGPREGYWGDRLGSKAFDRHLGWHERAIEIPGRVSIDASGLQRWEPDVPTTHRVLVVGGSVAFGAYASSIERTYFAELGRRLAANGVPAQVSVLAAGAWWSANELSALRTGGLALDPDVVVFLDGLNDLTERRAVAPDVRVADYLRNLGRARDRVRLAGGDVVFAPQPFPFEKRVRTPVERRILCISCDATLPRRVLESRYREMRDGLAELAASDPGSQLVDLAGAFADMEETTFADLWHFSDFGHAVLAERLAPTIERVLRERAPVDG